MFRLIVHSWHSGRASFKDSLSRESETLLMTQKQNVQTEKIIADMLGVVYMHREVCQTSRGRHKRRRLRTWLVKPTGTGVLRTKEIQVDIHTPMAILFHGCCRIPPFIWTIIHHPSPTRNITIPDCSDPFIKFTSRVW